MSKNKKLKDFGNNTNFAIKQVEGAEEASVAAAQEGHNSKPGVNPALQQIFLDVEKLQCDQKEISKAIRGLVNEAKGTHNVTSRAFRFELGQRKLDAEVRKQFEHEISDLYHMLGYELAQEVQEDNQDVANSDDADPVEAGKREAKKLKSV